MKTLRFTLVADGSSDACLLHIIHWVLGQLGSERLRELKGQFADLRPLSDPPKGLAERIRVGIHQFPCDVVFVHRDAERETLAERRQEIERALAPDGPGIHVPMVPVRMTEAWLLIDERAIRRAADNPNGASEIPLPPIRKLEAVPDPKEVLRECLVEASEQRGRRRHQFLRSLPSRIQRVAGLIRDFAPLRQLPAFQAFESETRRVFAGILETQC